MVDLILVTWNRRRRLERILRNVKNKAGFPHRMIIIQVPGLDDTDEFLKQNPELFDDWFKTEKREGLCDNYNLGLARGKNDICVFMQDDWIIYGQGWLKKMHEVYLSHLDRFFSISPFVFSYSMEKQPIRSFEDKVISISRDLATYRMFNRLAVLKAGGLHYVYRVPASTSSMQRQNESLVFPRLVAKISKDKRLGQYLDLRILNMDHRFLRGLKQEKKDELFDYFELTGKIDL